MSDATVLMAERDVLRAGLGRFRFFGGGWRGSVEGERLDEPHAADHAGAEAHGNWKESSRISERRCSRILMAAGGGSRGVVELWLEGWCAGLCTYR